MTQIVTDIESRAKSFKKGDAVLILTKTEQRRRPGRVECVWLCIDEWCIDVRTVDGRVGIFLGMGDEIEKGKL